MKRSILEQSWAVAKPRHAEAAYNHRRRLAINIGAAKILEKFIFRQKILKSSLLFSPKFLTTSFFSHRQPFYKNDTFHSKCTPFRDLEQVLRTKLLCNTTVSAMLRRVSALLNLSVRRAISKLSCIVLYCIVLYCIVLHCIVLYCIVFYCIVLYCIVLYCIV